MRLLARRARGRRPARDARSVQHAALPRRAGADEDLVVAAPVQVVAAVVHAEVRRLLLVRRDELRDEEALDVAQGQQAHRDGLEVEREARALVRLVVGRLGCGRDGQLAHAHV